MLNPYCIFEIPQRYYIQMTVKAFPFLLVIYLLLPFCNNAQSASDIFTFVDEPPHPAYSLDSYLVNNIVYPEKAKDSGIEGRVVLKFVVDENGSIANVQILKHVQYDMDTTALGVIKRMPPWVAGKKDGKNVKTYFTQPVSFKLSENQTDAVQSTIYSTVDQQAKPTVDLELYLYQHIKYPNNIKEIDSLPEGQFVIVIDETGRVKQASVYKSYQPTLDTLAIHAIMEMPEWIPATIANKPVCSYLLLPVEFQFAIDTGIKDTAKKEFISEELAQPDFDMGQYLSKNLHYPEQAMENNIMGRVIVRFTINVNGSISNVHVIKHVHPLLDREAIRIISSMPKWIPGKQNGKPVKTYFTQPITFSLE